ncbi:MAG: Rrf2 family transcriptional regulator [Candidatus Delongbacteria bacterium]|nr:Rrf2 family transcriptional regulator [Candidatus Delongbacteria bacterium]
MKISTRTRYGFRFLIHLARLYGQPPVQLHEIAEQEQIPRKYLEQIMLQLRNATFIQVKRGAHGGYSLSRHPADIALLEVFEILEGPVRLVECTDHAQSCARSAICPMQGYWAELSDSIGSLMRNQSLQQLLDRYHRIHHDHPVPDYSI